jgi:RNA polymerase sigma factor (sigma-70 family)
MTPPFAITLTALLERYERPLIRYAQSIVGDLENARDIVQETFIRYAQLSVRCCETTAETTESSAATPPTDPKHLEAWLFTVTRNRSLDHLRKFSRIIPMPLPEDRRSEEPGPDQALESRDAAAWMAQLLEQLTPNQREVVRLKFQNDLSYQDIAQLTGLSITNVGFLLHVGLKKLRTLLLDAPTDSVPFQLRNYR